MRIAATLVLTVPLALAGCGDASTDRRASAPGAAPGVWQTQQLTAEVGADQAPLLETSGDDALVVTVSEEGTLLSHLSTGGEAFKPGTPLETGLAFLLLGGAVQLPGGDWFALGTGGMVTINGDDEFTYEAVGFHSADGLTWEQADVTGFAQPTDVNDLTVVDGTIVVAGAYRTATNPSMGGFEAHVWTSDDGRSFDERDLPGVRPPHGYRNESYAGSVAVTENGLLAAGRVDSSAAAWTSDDSGQTWEQVADPVLAEAYAVSGLAVLGERVLAGTGDGSVPALQSADGGHSWEPADGLPSGDDESGWAPVWADQQRFWTLTGVDDSGWDEPEVCYADIDQCATDQSPQVLTSPDGGDWTPAKVPGELDEITGTADGRVIALGMTGDGPVVHSIAAGTSPPGAPELAKPTTVELVTVAEGESPEVGVRYHAPMFVHCGMDWFWLGDTTWRRTDDGPDVETGGADGAPDDWPLAGQVLYGYATLTDADHLEYSFDADVVATYARADGAPGCD